jgi:NSS family neurotransmitter:Na+ symporter
VTGDSYITAIINSAISLFAGFVVFAVLGYMSKASSVGIEEVVASGPGLAFVVFPQALSLMPFAWFFSALFFLMLLTLGIDSAFSLVEAVNTVIGDKYVKPNKERISFVVCSVAFLLGIIFTTGAGLYFLDIVDHFITSFGLVLVGIFECIAIGWIYGADRLRNYVNSVSRFKIGSWWNFAIKFVIPIVLIILLAAQFMKELSGPYEGYPYWALSIGWASVIIPLIIAVGLAFDGKK